MLEQRDNWWTLLALGLALALTLTAGTSPVQAAELRQGDEVVIGPGEVVNDDLYAFGGTVRVLGTVNGDLIAAGGNVFVEGPVQGDVLAAAGNVAVSAPVRGSVRAAGGNVTIGVPVDDDVLVAGGNVRVDPNGMVGRDLWAGSGTLSIAGQVGGDLLAGAGQTTLSGSVGGNVQAGSGQLRVEDGAVIGGDLSYVGDQQDYIAPGATVRGQIQQREPEPGPPPRGPLATAVDALIGWIRLLIGTLVFGALFLALFPRFGERAAERVRRSPWASLGLGAALFFGVPLAGLLVFLLGLAIGGWWLALVGLALYSILLVVGYVVTALRVGRWLTERLGRPSVRPYAPLAAGLALLLLVGIVPVVGWAVSLAAALFGLGAVVLAFTQTRREAPAATAAP